MAKLRDICVIRTYPRAGMMLEVQMFKPYTPGTLWLAPVMVSSALFPEALTSLVSLGLRSCCLSPHCACLGCRSLRFWTLQDAAFMLSPRPSAFLLLTSVSAMAARSLYQIFIYEAKRPVCLCVQGPGSGCWQVNVFMQYRWNKLSLFLVKSLNPHFTA